LDHRADSQVIFKWDGSENSVCALCTADASSSTLDTLTLYLHQPISFFTITPGTPETKSCLKNRTKGFQHPEVLQWEAFCLSTGHFHCNLGSYEPITNIKAITNCKGRCKSS